MSDGHWKATMSEFATFGDPERFEIAVRWTSDGEPRARRPSGHGWSVGDIKITIANQVLTRSRRSVAQQSHVGWYLAPFFDWIASNWAALLHEEDFAWNERSGAPAVVACHRALDKWIGARDSDGRVRYKEAQAWYYRHAIRSAAEGGLFPDLFVRRFLDDIELSWSAEPPLFAPDGFSFMAEPGVARLPIEDVASPLWEVLAWVASEPPKLDDEDRASWQGLSTKIECIPTLSEITLDRAYVDERILELVRTSLDRIGHLELIADDVRASQPFVREFSPAVAMFGGVSPNLQRNDVDALCHLLVDRASGRDGARLASLVASHKESPLGIPHEDGYSFAEEFLTDVGLPGDKDWIDIRAVVEELGIDVLERALDTDSIRGVALAGNDFGPTILINTTSPFNASEYGKRFTIAHELCHIIFDRTRARRVTHVSGQWVAPGIERRANAFAAYILMPRALVVRHWRSQNYTSHAEFSALANKMHVNETALIEHLYNIELIDEIAREHLRKTFRLN